MYVHIRGKGNVKAFVFSSPHIACVPTICCSTSDTICLKYITVVRTCTDSRPDSSRIYVSRRFKMPEQTLSTVPPVWINISNKLQYSVNYLLNSTDYFIGCTRMYNKMFSKTEIMWHIFRTNYRNILNQNV